MKPDTSSQAAAPAERPPAERTSLRDHPIGFWFFFWGEFAERCCYYGMRAILLLYMIQIIKFDDGKATMIQSYFMAACYLLPLIGGYVADNYLGKYRTIVYFCIPYIFGQAMLGIAALHNETCLFLSLGLLAMGTGVIKPNISTLMGLTYDQHRPGRTRLRSDAFAMFYGAINIGAAISSFGVPAIRNYLGGDSRAYAIAFLFPALLMIMAFIVFALGKPFYAVETVRRVRLTPEERRQRWVVLSRLLGLFMVVAIFWSLYDQSVSTWVLLTRDYLDLGEFGVKFSPDQIQAVNPVLVVLLLPPVTLLWHWLPRVGVNLKPTSKMLIGFVLTGITMVIITWAAFRGAQVARAGAPAALAAAEKAAQAAADAATDPRANLTADMMVAATAAKRAVAAAKDTPSGLPADDPRLAHLRAAGGAARSAAKVVESQQSAFAAQCMQAANAALQDSDAEVDGESAAKAAAEAMEAAKKAVHKVDPVALVKAAAAKSAVAATVAAREAYAVAALESGDSQSTVRQALAAGKRAQAAANATRETVDLARDVAKERAAEEPELKEGFRKVSPTCSMAANRAADAANAAVKAAEAMAKAGDANAAQTHAAVASLAAADAAAEAAQAAAGGKGAAVPPVVAETEQIAAAARISLFWQIIPYVIITIAEICISVVGLELAFTAAPASMKSFITACWLLTVFFGDILNAQITPLYNETVLGYSIMPGVYFLASTLLMVPVTAAFAFMARRFNRAAAC